MTTLQDEAGVDDAEAVSPLECTWCGASLATGAQRAAGRVICGACGAAVTDPLPQGRDLEAAYGGWYRPSGGRRFSLAGDALLRRTRGALARRLDAISPDGPILDVGAGDGTLIDALRRRGRRAEGLERGARRSDLRDEPLEEVEGVWAAVVFWHSLEHLPAPGAAIAEAARLLGPGGLIAVAVPNTASLQAHLFGDRWLHLDLPRHLIHLSAANLLDGLRASGFTIERVSHFRGGQILIGWLDGLVGSLPGGLNLYQSLRRADARSVRISSPRRLAALAAGVVLAPLAAVCAALEILLRRGGTVYVEARIDT